MSGGQSPSNLYDGLEKVELTEHYVLDRLTSYEDPPRFILVESLRDLFEEIQAHKVSDIMFQEAKPVCVLKDGHLFAVTKRVIDRSEAQWFLSHIGSTTSLAQISSTQAINLSYSIFDADEKKLTRSGTRVLNNYRVNACGTMAAGERSFQIVLRTIPSEPYKFNDIGLDESFVLKCCPSKGIVLIAGVTGSGKSTTLSSIIRYILENNTPIHGNIITHEEPIEYTYDTIISHHSIVLQSQIPENFKTFSDANREAMRRKPAAILVGELRDAETISAAIEASLTGHPVFATIHSSSVSTILSRLLSRYPTEEKSGALYDIISCSKMLVAQRLISKANGKLMGVQEWLLLTNEIRAELLSLATSQLVNQKIRELMDSGTGNNHASLTFAKQGIKLVNDGIINPETLVYLTEE